MPPPDPAQGERRAEDGRIAGGLDGFQRLLEASDGTSLRGRQTDTPHGAGKLLPVLGQSNGPFVRSDQLHAVSRERAVTLKSHGHVQGGLPTHGRQQRLGTLALDHLGNPLGRHRLDVGPVRQLGIGHDRGGIRVDQDHPIPLLLQRLHRLGSRVVELRTLTDDDGSGADQKDGGEISTLGHRPFLEESAPE